MKTISVKEQPLYKKRAIKYFQDKWAKHGGKIMFDDCISNCIVSESILPQWYLLMDKDEIIGCAGLIPNDFISRMDLYPWLCSLYIEKDFRGNSYGALLIEKIKSDAKKLGFKNLYLCTNHIGFYEKYGFEFIAIGYHLQGESLRIYGTKL